VVAISADGARRRPGYALRYQPRVTPSRVEAEVADLALCPIAAGPRPGHRGRLRPGEIGSAMVATRWPSEGHRSHTLTPERSPTVAVTPQCAHQIPSQVGASERGDRRGRRTTT
jgi:hypothetical protein